jgi:hypothetical protein
VPFGYRNGTLACVRVTDAIRYILAQHGIFVFNYIDDLIGLAPDFVADKHFKFTINLVNTLGFVISNSKTVAPTYVATCLGISFNIQLGVLSIPNTKLHETISLCNFYLNKKYISKHQLQVLIGTLMFLHKAIKPTRVFVNRILALLRNMGHATKAAIDEGTKRDLQWFKACAHAINGTVQIFKCVRPRIDIFVDASLSGLGGAFNNYVYAMAIIPRPEFCINHWEAINILVALRTFSKFIQGSHVTIWCDNQTAVSSLNLGRGADPVLHSISRNLWLIQAGSDCSLQFSHIKGKLNVTADILSRWHSLKNPVASLFYLLNNIPIWVTPPEDALFVNEII